VRATAISPVPRGSAHRLGFWAAAVYRRFPDLATRDPFRFKPGQKPFSCGITAAVVFRLPHLRNIPARSSQRAMKSAKGSRHHSHEAALAPTKKRQFSQHGAGQVRRVWRAGLQPTKPAVTGGAGLAGSSTHSCRWRFRCEPCLLTASKATYHRRVDARHHLLLGRSRWSVRDRLGPQHLEPNLHHRRASAPSQGTFSVAHHR
jgi:hypothetical protein